MCGRYYFGEDTEKEIRDIVAEGNQRADWSLKGDVRPSDSPVVIKGGTGGFIAVNMRWGFPAYQSKQLMINARAETVLERKSFSDSVLYRRCVVPASHFYEWDYMKNQVRFGEREGGAMYMAGFYKCFEDGERFVILTVAANEEVSPVHDRMPLILEEKEIGEWIFETSRVKEFLRKTSSILRRQQDYEQMSLF